MKLNRQMLENTSNLIVLTNEALQRTAASEWGFDSIGKSDLQSQVSMYCHIQVE